MTRGTQVRELVGLRTSNPCGDIGVESAPFKIKVVGVHAGSEGILKVAFKIIVYSRTTQRMDIRNAEK